MVDAKRYIPKRGDIVWLDFMPQSGKEISKRRPALTISSSIYNKKGLAWFCPITSNIQLNNPFKIMVLNQSDIEGAIVTDQIRCLDWREREACYICRLDDKTFQSALDLLQLLLNADE
jgi:mRNA interferase MazF